MSEVPVGEVLSQALPTDELPAPDKSPVFSCRVLARKYRPQDFTSMIGQEAIIRTLRNGFAHQRIAQAYMLTGVRGVGKTTLARLMARALNYLPQPSVSMPVMTDHCQAILEGRHLDVIEMDAASNTGVDNMREIIEQVRYAPVAARYKVYIIDEVHMLSKSAFNALLKTLEEPPPHVKFIFATTEIRKVPATILSRCQRFGLKRLSIELLIAHFRTIAAREQVRIDEESLRLIARGAEGSVRDGLSLLDQAIAYGSGVVQAQNVSQMLGLQGHERTLDLFDAIMAGDPARALQETGQQYEAGGDPQALLVDLADCVHWVTRLKIAGDGALADQTRSEIEKTRGLAFAASLTIPSLARAWKMLLKGLEELASAHNPEAAAEMLIIRLCHAASVVGSEDLVRLIGDQTVLKDLKSQQRQASSPTPSSPERARQLPVPSCEGTLARDQHQFDPESDRAEGKFAPMNFNDLIALAQEKRDIRLKFALENFIRPIKTQAGRLEFALEPDAPAHLPGEIMRKLEDWTGRRWLVSVENAGGDVPLAKQAQKMRASHFQSAQNLPDVAEVFRYFPQARLLDVRDFFQGPDFTGNDDKVIAQEDDNDEESC